jgi:1-aminocyclopropane-1-carboxylate deaminase
MNTLLSFGGAWSNHLHALAAVGAELGLETIGVVRGGEEATPALEDLRRFGMRVIAVSRRDYRRRNDNVWLGDLQRRYGPCVIIPEGGASVEGVRGCLEIADMINALDRRFSRILLPVGTGTTLAGLVAGLRAETEVVGVSALKGASDLESRIQQSLAEASMSAKVPWRILHEDHCGGFARTHRGLREFMLEFERVQGIPLEPVYTGKVLYALHTRLAQAQWSSTESILAVHTGGLQGRRGYDWLP